MAITDIVGPVSRSMQQNPSSVHYYHAPELVDKDELAIAHDFSWVNLWKSYISARQICTFSQ